MKISNVDHKKLKNLIKTGKWDDIMHFANYCFWNNNKPKKCKTLT